MHTDKDGVFVVEVARGIDSKQLTGDHSGVTLDATELPFDNKLAPNGGHLLEKTLPSHEQVQIHAPPQDFATGHPAPLHLIEEAEEHVAEDLSQQAVETPAILARTGLSQSDLSSTSSSDSNKRYSYGNQELYVIEQPGYATSSPTAKPILISPNQNSGQDLEQKSQLSTSTEQTEIDSSQGTKKPDEEVARPEEAVKEIISEKEVAKPLQKEVATPPDYEVKTTPEEAVDVKQEESVVPEKLTEVQPVVDDVASRYEEEVPPKEELPPPTVEVSPPKEDQVPIENEVQEQEEKPDNQVEVQTESNPDPTGMNAKLPDESLKPEETVEIQNEPEAESNYDSLMSLPAPPSTEEIKELGDYALMESNQLDSLPPPPPPLQDVPSTPPASGRPAAINVSNENGTGKVSVVITGGGLVGGGAEEPSTLTPPASPPATPPPSQTSTQYASNGLTNGIHALAVVDVNGS